MDGNTRRGFELRWRSSGAAVTAPVVASEAADASLAEATRAGSDLLIAPAPDMTGEPSDQEQDTAVVSVLDATRALLWIETRTEAASLACSLVDMLGGVVVPATGAGSEAIPIDISFGAGAPMLPSAPPGSVPRAMLEMHVPGFVRDTHRALELADRTTRLAEEASVDSLTGVSNRRMLGRTLGRLRHDDTVIVIDLDHFKAVNDTFGHAEGDRVLRALGKALNESIRASDRVGRYGGEEFVVVLSGGQADPFLRRFRHEWVARRPHPVTFSAGIAPAGPDPRTAFKAADRAMYRAKLYGRDQWQWATQEEYA